MRPTRIEGYSDMAGRNVNIPLLLREKFGEDFEPEKVVGYQYSIGYTTEDRDFPIENYYCEKEEYWADDAQKKICAEKKDLSRWDERGFAPKPRGYFELFYKSDNGQWPLLCWAYIDVYMADGNNEEAIRIETKHREDVIYGAFEGLRRWLETLFNKTEQQCADAFRHIRLSVSSYYFDSIERKTVVTEPIEFEELITEEQEERIRTGMLGSDYYSPKSYGAWAEKGEALLVETFGPQNPLARILLDWGKGERQRLTQGCRFVTRNDIDAKLSFLASLGDKPPIREEVLAGIEDCFMWEETWTRETGHLWNKYSLLRRTPTQEEYDYADTWDFKPVRLRKFPTETIVNMLNSSL